MRHRLAALIAAIAMFVSAGAPAGALADGDPASDVLLGQAVFFPYQPAVSKTLMQRLTAELAAAANNHFPIKVALIASPLDLGVVPSLFGQPQAYAHFLEQEISFQGAPLLLVVMPDGYGVEGLPAPATAAAKQLPKPAADSGAANKSDALAQAALAAVPKLAAAAGHQVPRQGGGATTQSGGGGLSTKTLIVIVLVLAAIATAGALIAVRRRTPT